MLAGGTPAASRHSMEPCEQMRAVAAGVTAGVTAAAAVRDEEVSDCRQQTDPTPAFRDA